MISFSILHISPGVTKNNSAEAFCCRVVNEVPIAAPSHEREQEEENKRENSG